MKQNIEEHWLPTEALSDKELAEYQAEGDYGLEPSEIERLSELAEHPELECFEVARARQDTWRRLK